MEPHRPSSEVSLALRAVIGLAVASQLIATYYRNGLNRYPGPVLAKFTRFWYWLDVKRNRHPHHLIKLHRKYGDVVRIGPNSLSLSNAEYVPRLYGISHGYEDAFDVILEVTLSDTLGFLDKGGDIDDFFQGLDDNIDAASLLVTMPWTAYIVKHNPLVSYFSKDSTMFPGWTARRVQNRLKERAEKERVGSKYSPRDFLDRFIDAAHTGPNQEFQFAKALNWTLTNVMAGGDTTTMALKAIIYYLLKNPAKKDRLVKDLEAVNLSVPVSWAKSQQIPYLDAVIKESLRIHPPIGLGLERTAGGFQMPDGYILPPGTNVGMNSWVVNRHPVFGDNVDDFVPERWLKSPDETETQHRERVNDMKRADLVFGSGARACTGRNVSYLEMYKVVPSVLLTFHLDALAATDEWTLVCGFGVRQDNIKCVLRKRETKEAEV